MAELVVPVYVKIEGGFFNGLSMSKYQAVWPFPRSTRRK
jgi:hypothetical protein